MWAGSCLESLGTKVSSLAGRAVAQPRRRLLMGQRWTGSSQEIARTENGQASAPPPLRASESVAFAAGRMNGHGVTVHPPLPKRLPNPLPKGGDNRPHRGGIPGFTVAGPANGTLASRPPGKRRRTAAGTSCSVQQLRGHSSLVPPGSDEGPGRRSVHAGKWAHT